MYTSSHSIFVESGFKVPAAHLTFPRKPKASDRIIEATPGH